MTDERLREVLEAQTFRVAKTMPNNPHAYTLRKNWTDDKLFEACVTAIREKGKTVMFWRKPYIVWDCNGWRYWSMGWPADETELINRRKI